VPPQRQLSLISTIALVVASMVGTGVFTTSGFLLADLHSPARVLAAWLVGGLIALLGATCYAALARQFPESGGEYIFLSRTLHPAAGYLAGWISLLVGFSAPLAAVALAFGEYLKDWLPAWSPRVTGSVLVLVMAAPHAVHVQRGAWTQNVAVLIKLVLIALLLAVAGTRLEPTTTTPAADFSIGAFAVALVWISFSYSGWNVVIYLAGEVHDPGRNLSRAMITGTAIVTVLYLALNAAFVFAAPAEKLAGQLEVARIAAAAVGGARLADFVTTLIALALATSASSMLMAGPRVYARMADDGHLPRWLRSPQSGPPRAAILFQTAIALILLWTATFTGLLTYIGFTLGLCTAAAVAGLMRLRLREGARIHVAGWPWLPLLFIALVVAATTFTMARQPLESGIGLMTILGGWILWRFAYGGRGRGGLGWRR